MSKNLTVNVKEYIFIILTATIFLLTTFTKSFSQENVFIVNNIRVSGTIDVNFTREKYINIALKNSFKTLMARILTKKDLNKLGEIKLGEIKKLVNNFQILEESYKKNKYEINLKILYSDKRIKELLFKKNISFSQPKNISAVFFPVLFINNDIKNFSENYFYKKWEKVEINNEIIDFILPLEDLEDFAKINEMKNTLDELDVSNIASKYNSKNYAFVFMNYDNKKLNIHIKTNFDDNKVSKNIFYEIDDINDEIKLNFILKELKIQILDIWKQSNVVNLLMPLSIRLKFQHSNLLDLNKLRKTFRKISIIDTYTLEEFTVNRSYFKIYYYGNPKKLRSEFLKFDYLLRDDQGHWELYINE